MAHDPVLVCQDCGDVIRRLSDAEAQQVARNPYNFIVYCTPCKLAIQKKLERNPFYGMD